MTKEQALIEYEEAGKLIDNLEQKRANLKKVIFSEQITPTVIRKAESKGGWNARGVTKEIVYKAMAEYDKPMSAKEIKTLTGLREKQIHGALYNGLVKHLVHKHGQGSDVKWSMAVHRDKSELNHL